MAEGGGAHRSKSFAKSFQKKLVRTKEKVLQNVGKADKTQDVVFDQHVQHFNTQCQRAMDYKKELQNYICSARAMEAASKSFHSVIRDMYEEEWVGHRGLHQILQNLEDLWNDYTTKLTESVQEPFHVYVNEFPGLKTKVAKRGRKLTDYDCARHAVASLEAAKKKDDAKLQKAYDDLRDSKAIYEEINNELLHTLPDLYDKRVGITAANFRALFECEQTFQHESAKLKGAIVETAEQLQKENYNIAPTPSRVTNGTNEYVESPASRALPAQGISLSFNNELSDSMQESPSPTSEKRTSTPKSPTEVNDAAISQRTSQVSEERPVSNVSAEKTVNHESMAEGSRPSSQVQGAERTSGVVENSKEEGAYEDVEKKETSKPAPTENVDSAATEVKRSSTGPSPAPRQSDPQAKSQPPASPTENNLYQVPTSNEPVKLPAGVLFQVVATHPYSGDDYDELSFETGDVINVIPFDDPEEQDEGWLNGVLVKNGEKGVFPENFTKKL